MDIVDPRIGEYERRYHTTLDRKHPLGTGRDGLVLYTDRITAVKFLDRADAYLRERDTYQVFKALGIIQILNQNVPEFVRCDDELRAIEMSIVRVPYLLDFASAYLVSEAPDFSAEVWEDWQARMIELFEDDWAEVERICDEFCRVTGRVLLDINPGNVTFVR